MISVCKNLSSMVWTMQCLVLVILFMRTDLTWLVSKTIITFMLFNNNIIVFGLIETERLIVEVVLNKLNRTAGRKEC